MPNKATRIIESIKSNAGIEVYKSIIANYGIPEEKWTPNRQSKYIKSVLSELENSYGEDFVSKIMYPCGRQCLSKGVIENAKTAYGKSASLKDFLNKLNEQHIGGGKLNYCDGKIIGIYDKCYCGIAKQNNGLSSCYCNCSIGWFGKLFSSVLEKEVDVRKIQTILDGAGQCIFEIYLTKN